MICPKDGQPCMDDLCVFSCLYMPGVEPLIRCVGCGELIGEDFDCACEPEPYDYDAEDEQPGIG